MSEVDIDRLPRMKDYLKPEDLNTTACVNLAATVLEEQANALTHAARKAAMYPTKDNIDHLKKLRDFYKTPWFEVLSCGLADGEQIAKMIIKRAVRGMNVQE